MEYEKDIVLNLLGITTVILAVGLIIIGKWVRSEVMTKAIFAQAIAMTCAIAAAFMIKG